MRWGTGTGSFRIWDLAMRQACHASACLPLGACVTNTSNPSKRPSSPSTDPSRLRQGYSQYCWLVPYQKLHRQPTAHTPPAMLRCHLPHIPFPFAPARHYPVAPHLPLGAHVANMVDHAIHAIITPPRDPPHPSCRSHPARQPPRRWSLPRPAQLSWQPAQPGGWGVGAARHGCTRERCIRAGENHGAQRFIFHPRTPNGVGRPAGKLLARLAFFLRPQCSRFSAVAL